MVILSPHGGSGRTLYCYAHMRLWRWLRVIPWNWYLCKISEATLWKHICIKVDCPRKEYPLSLRELRWNCLHGSAQGPLHIPGQPCDSPSVHVFWAGQGVRQGLFQWLPIESWCINGMIDSWWIHLPHPLAFSLSSPLTLSCCFLCLQLCFLGGKGRCNSDFLKMGKRGSCHYWQKWYLCIL